MSPLTLADYTLAPDAQPQIDDLPPPSDRLADTLGADQRPFYQGRTGLRVGADTLALARYAVAVGHKRVGSPPKRIAELCAGSGLIACKLGLAFPESIGWAVELDPALSALLALNLATTGLSGRWQGVRSDLGPWTSGPLPIAPEPRLDLMAINPPWYVPGRGPSSPHDPARMRARSEATLTLDQWVRVCARLLAPQGRVVVLYPSGRISELFVALERHGLKPIELVTLRTHPERPARRCMITCARGHSQGDLIIRSESMHTTEITP